MPDYCPSRSSQCSPSRVGFPFSSIFCVPVLSCQCAAGDTNGTNGYDDEEEETNQKSPAGWSRIFPKKQDAFYLSHVSHTHIMLFVHTYISIEMFDIEFQITHFFTQYFSPVHTFRLFACGHES